MKRFVSLYQSLDQTTSTLEKIQALCSYFEKAPPNDAAWALYFLTGRKIKKPVNSSFLKEWAREKSDTPEWLFEECYSTVGDLAETISLLVNSVEPKGSDLSFSQWVEERVIPLRQRDIDLQKKEILSWWGELDRSSLFILCKLLTGGFRVGVSSGLIERALSEYSKVPRPKIAHRLMGHWVATDAFFNRLVSTEEFQSEFDSHPYPFYLASPLSLDLKLEDMEGELGGPENWTGEWKWDGIRAQWVFRGGKSALWSRGEEIVTERFPEIVKLEEHLPSTCVLDGEIVAFRDKKIGTFADLQKRIGRLKVSPQMTIQNPTTFIAYDLLEVDGKDLRSEPYSLRRERLREILAQTPILLSESLEASNWSQFSEYREESRKRGVEGLILKRKSSPYQEGRKRGDWWKWKIDPFTIDAVLLYAQPGHGRRSGLFTDYTFGLWKDGRLVPIAKAYSGLSDAEIQTLDKWIRTHTIERFGPVRSVNPIHVFELAFEGVALSSRHKSGVAVRFPRILRWRVDKPAPEANALQDLIEMVREARA